MRQSFSQSFMRIENVFFFYSNFALRVKDILLRRVFIFWKFALLAESLCCPSKIFCVEKFLKSATQDATWEDFLITSSCQEFDHTLLASVMTVVENHRESSGIHYIFRPQWTYWEDFLISCKTTCVRAVKNRAHFY